jgi:putative ABC transport system substrate-binding protein
MPAPLHLTRRRSLQLLLGAAGAALLPAACRRTAEPAGPPRLGLLQFVRAAPPDAARAGFLAGLARGGFGPAQGVRVLQRSAGGSMATARQQVRELLSTQQVTMLVAVGTPALNACLQLAPAAMPVVFCYCSNPWGVGAGHSYGQHRSNVTGTVSTNPVAAQLDLVRRLQPDLQRLGLIYDPAQANAGFEAELLRREAARRPLSVEAEPVTGPSEVAQAAQRLLAREVEAFVTVGDYATIEAFDQLAAAALRGRVPVYSVEPAAIAVPGCLAVVGWDPRSDGLQAAGLAVKVLRGTPPADLPFESARDQLLLLNAFTARRLGIALPASLRVQADRVVS